MGQGGRVATLYDSVKTAVNSINRWCVLIR